MITTQIIKDSFNPRGSRLTTAVLTYPKFIHAELMTHRMLSRNAASSRAIPTPKLLDMIFREPALPEYWGANQKGMQAGGELTGLNLEHSQSVWNDLRLTCLDGARRLNTLGLHKQIANRCIEPWSPITVIVTGTDKAFGNFFGLRCHKDAQPEFQVLAYSLLSDYVGSQPMPTAWNEWHIPFDGNGDFESHPIQTDTMTAIKVATARCARISYLTFDGKFDIEADCKLHDDLAAAGHWSPFEHCAQALDKPNDLFRVYPYSNFDTYSTRTSKTGIWHLDGARPSGWGQYRKLFNGELREPTETELQGLFNQMPGWIFERIAKYKQVQK